MLDNAVFIDFPEDEQTPISVFGESLVFIHRAIRMFQELVRPIMILYLLVELKQKQMTDLSQAIIQLKSAIILPSEVSDLRKYPDTSNIKTFYRIALETGADIVQYKTSIEIWGHRSSINQAYVQIMQQPWIKKSLKSTKFQIELAEAHRDFLNGKKNGKLNKIMNASGCRLVLHESYNGYNFLIDLFEDLEQEYLQGIQLLEDELPAELSFYIPEPLHKRIIGVGGKNIQKIMKQFGVFVKFSNIGEFKEIGGYQENTHNVIARTPAKNAENLSELRTCIIDSIQEDIERLTDTVDIPRELHRILNAFYATIIRSSELDNDAKIEFPDKEDASEEVVLSAYNPKKLEVVKRTLLVRLNFHLHSPKLISYDRK